MIVDSDEEDKTPKATLSTIDLPTPTPSTYINTSLSQRFKPNSLSLSINKII
jgi:hypothetical protein